MTAMTWSANLQTSDSVEMINVCAAPTKTGTRIEHQTDLTDEIKYKINNNTNLDKPT